MVAIDFEIKFNRQREIWSIQNSSVASEKMADPKRKQMDVENVDGDNSSSEENSQFQLENDE